MTKKLEIYKCNVCGNIIEVLNPQKGILVCCDQNMELKIENKIEASKEKHIPQIEKIENGYKVKIGSIPHPMEEAHYIEWIELIADNKVYREFLKPKDAPEAIFKIDAKNVIAREYCNIHGLWKS